MKSFLRDRDWIKERVPEFRLQNIKEMLYTWAKGYHKKDNRFLNSIRSKQFQNWNRKFLGEFSDNLRIIDGWVPALLYPDSEHIGKKVHYLVKKIENKRIEKSSMQRKAKDSEGSL